MATIKYRSRRAGFSTATYMTFAFATTMVGLGSLALTNSRERISGVSHKKVQSNLLAEAGIEALYDQIRNEMKASGNYSFELSSRNLTQGTGSGATNFGSYEARILRVDQNEQDLGSGGSRYRRTTYTFQLEGKGKAASGPTSVVRARFVSTRDVALVPQTSNPPNFANNPVTFPVGAIVSNSKVNIKTDQGVKTTSPDGRSGHVLANQGIVWNVASGNKNSVRATDVLDIQGQYVVPNGGAYQLTVGPNGMGNANGVTNYRNPGLPAQGNFLGSPANSVVRSSGPISFASDSRIDSWVSRWQGAIANTTPLPTTNSSQVGPVNGLNNTLRCPVVINGDLNVDAGTTLRLLPKSTNPWENVIYVKGNIRNAGELLNLGVTLVVEGKYVDTPSAKYDLSEVGSPFGTSTMVRMRASMMSLNQNDDAVTLNQNASSTIGLIYALKGGIRMYGSGASLTGSVVAGSSSSGAGVTIEPSGGGRLEVNFDPYSATGGPLRVDPGETIWVPGPVTMAWNPNRVSNWAYLQ